ncbi:hypothetical protein C3L33_03178, partial [Rhododendron williamsianum]
TMKAIFCGNFDYEARQSDLERLFRKYGKVDRVDMKSGKFGLLLLDFGMSIHFLTDQWASSAFHFLAVTSFLFLFPRRATLTSQSHTILRHQCISCLMNLAQPSFSDTFPGRNHATLNAEASEYMEKALFSLSYHETSTFPFLFLDIIYFITQGFAFVYMEDDRDAEDAIRGLDRYEYGRKGRRLRVEWTKDATKAIEATNMSKLMDRVISVEYAVKDDDDRRNGHSPDRGRDRSPGRRGHERGRSLSPVRRERASPDYGRGRSPSPRRERGSPDYGRGHSRSPQRKERTNSDYGRSRSSPVLGERGLVLIMSVNPAQEKGGLLLIMVVAAQSLQERGSVLMTILVAATLILSMNRERVQSMRKERAPGMRDTRVVLHRHEKEKGRDLD